MKYPRLVLADWIEDVPRPEVRIDWSTPWWRRFTLAWGVFTGKYDALKWIEQ